MNIRTITQNLELSPAIETYVAKKIVPIERLLKTAPPETMIEVDLSKDAKHRKGQGFRAEMSVILSGKRIYAAAKDEELYAAIDKVKDEILSELKKSVSKKRDNERRSGSKIKSKYQR